MTWIARGCSPFLIALLLCVAAMRAGAQSEEAEAQAEKALGEFMTAWNQADNDALRKTLNFPHVTLSGGRMFIASEPSEFTTNFDAMREREGWARSSFDSIEVSRSSPDKVHCNVVYSRYGADGTAYRTATVMYVMTRKDGHWGMQFRGPGGPASDESTPQLRQAEEDARATVLDFFTAFNAADNDQLSKTINLPHAFLLGNGSLIVAEDPSGPGVSTNFDALRQRENWHMGTIDSMEPVSVAANQVCFEIILSRYHPNGMKYRTLPGLWILTRQGGQWGIQFRSLMPVLFSE